MSNKFLCCAVRPPTHTTQTIASIRYYGHTFDKRTNLKRENDKKNNFGNNHGHRRRVLKQNVTTQTYNRSQGTHLRSTTLALQNHPFKLPLRCGLGGAEINCKVPRNAALHANSPNSRSFSDQRVHTATLDKSGKPRERLLKLHVGAPFFSNLQYTFSFSDVIFTGKIMDTLDPTFRIKPDASK